MHGPINVKSPNNNIKWQMGFNSAFKGLKHISAFFKPLLNVELVNKFQLSRNHCKVNFTLSLERNETKQHKP